MTNKFRILVLTAISLLCACTAQGAKSTVSRAVPPIQASKQSQDFSLDSARTTFVMWQLPTVTDGQCLSYVISTASGETIIFDGGWPDDKTPLLQLLSDNGITEVNAWFITHCHDDHISAITQILETPGHIPIDKIYGSIPDRDWLLGRIGENASGIHNYEVQVYDRFLAAVRHNGMAVTPLSVEDLQIGGLTFQVLRVWNPAYTIDAMNNSCIVVRVTDSANSTLFLGDLSHKGSQEMLDGTVTPGIASRLPSDYVQVAHHGLYGVCDRFYDAVQPKWALWPAPMQWYLPGGEYTREVKAQLEALGIGEDRRFVSGRDGLTEFRFTIPPSQPGVVYMENGG